MDDNQSKSAKPLRTASNTAKDLENTYGKSMGVKNIPISSGDKDDVTVTEELEKETMEKEQQSEEKMEKSSQEEPDNANQKVDELKKENEELKDQVKRMAADLENFRRRSLKEKQELIEYANDRLMFKLLPVLDDLDKALESGKKATDYDALLTGVGMILQKTIKLFEEAGVKPMEDPTGKPFDYDLHEAVMVMPSDIIPEEHVIHEVQKGYMIHDKVLRHAKVVTSSGPENNQEDGQN